MNEEIYDALEEYHHQRNEEYKLVTKCLADLSTLEHHLISIEGLRRDLSSLLETTSIYLQQRLKDI